MPHSLAGKYGYLAFDKDAVALLAHGETAAHALLAADIIAPEAILRVIHVGAFGEALWQSWGTEKRAANGNWLKMLSNVVH